MTNLQTVNAGEPIQARQFNDVIDFLNEQAVPFLEAGAQYSDWTNAGENMPWYINPDTPLCADSCRRLHVQVGMKTYECSAYGGDELSGDFYCAVEKKLLSGESGKLSVVHESQLDSLKDKWEFIKTYTLHPNEVTNSDGEKVLAAPVAVEYHNVCPTFAGVASGAEPYGSWRWDSATSSFTYCNFQLGRAVYTLQDQTLTGDYGVIYLNVLHDQPEESKISTTPIDNTLSTTHVPLIQVDRDMQVVNDFRGMPVIPVWGSTQT